MQRKQMPNPLAFILLGQDRDSQDSRAALAPKKPFWGHLSVCPESSLWPPALGRLGDFLMCSILSVPTMIISYSSSTSPQTTYRRGISFLAFLGLVTSFQGTEQTVKGLQIQRRQARSLDLEQARRGCPSCQSPSWLAWITAMASSVSFPLPGCPLVSSPCNIQKSLDLDQVSCLCGSSSLE